MVYKFHQHKFDNMNRYYDVIREAMNQLGHSEVVEESPADIHFYNHIVNDEKSDNMIIVKPTAPTAKHFALDKHGYANTSEMAYEDPYVYEYMYSHLNPTNDMDWSRIDNLIANKSNKWDDSILLKWRSSKVFKNHILILLHQKQYLFRYHLNTDTFLNFHNHYRQYHCPCTLNK